MVRQPSGGATELCELEYDREGTERKTRLARLTGLVSGAALCAGLVLHGVAHRGGRMCESALPGQEANDAL